MEKDTLDSSLASKNVASKKAVSWEKVGNTLFLHGTLDRDSLLPLWQQKASVLEGIENIDVAQLSHVDSTGLALFVRLKEEWQQNGRTLTLSRVGERLKTLVELYGLQSLFDDNQSTT
ncbi:lipid asymmetry maintenance protein MlaB [Xenorhabdus hominickii]|uniref:Anti-sigma B factor antagonist n=1 Tax=Xenorhabdus hominickii TaxID=351679 RepID=A0A2G0QG01_XENHO|nr:lipid asymmetry maintenance protein MlaB [Xenorhabdus hominickii]AOM42157.1 anti-sigma B factor antagonist [Xenorhabdus hominickii]PHM58154.1 anti-sigma B factor antagonist [Xenorhabdus hominickii]